MKFAYQGRSPQAFVFLARGFMRSPITPVNLVLCQNIILGLFPGLVVGALALKRSLQTLIFSVDATLGTNRIKIV
jgi:uncharacterized membrane protein YqaE (UPF0057 family)